MGWAATARRTLSTSAKVVNWAVSAIVFAVLDVLDVALCYVYKLLDYAVDSEWKACYCSSSPKDVITGSGNIMVSSPEGNGGGGKPKVLCLTSASAKLRMEDVSDTLYHRHSLVSDLSKKAAAAMRSLPPTATLTVDSAVPEVLQWKAKGRQPCPVTRWSDCGCKDCSSSAVGRSLFVHAGGSEDPAAKETVVFIHGFISCSTFWTETVFPNLSEAAKSDYRLLAVDILGFGKSPKPEESLYTLGEHLDMIERSVLKAYNVGSFHIVAHSLGSILALALAARHPGAVMSLTLLAPPYFPTAEGEEGAQSIMRRLAPRRVFPFMAFAASLACWYEHVSRTICLLICRQHRLWVFIFKLITRNRFRTYLMEGFFCHTHNAAWHTLHNIICGSAGKIDGHLDAVRERLACNVALFHGRNDDLIPVGCSYDVKAKVPRARLCVLDGKDHITVVVGREKAFAAELEEIWKYGKRE